MEQEMIEQALNFKPKLSDKELVQQKQKELKEKIKETSIKLKGICNDAKFADALIDELLSLKGQYDVEPTLVHVPVTSVIKTYDFNHFRLYRTDKGIVFHMGGMYQLIPPMMQTLYGQLNFILDQKDKYVALSDEEKAIYELVFGGVMTILQTPTICFSNESYWFDIATYITSKQNELFKSMLDEPLQPEDPIADAEFNEKVAFIEELKQELKEKADEL